MPGIGKRKIPTVLKNKKMRDVRMGVHLSFFNICENNDQNKCAKMEKKTK